jgi:hypothetical protein
MIFNLEFGTRAAQWNTYKECRRILGYPFQVGLRSEIDRLSGR